jgi:hypothetical protein
MIWENQPKKVRDVLTKSIKIWAHTSRIFSRKDKIKKIFNEDRKEK